MAAGKKTGGRKAGTPNKITRQLTEAIDMSFDRVGGVDYLVRQAEENPVAYMTLLGKRMPKDLNIGGQADNPLTVNKIQIEFVDTKA
jgi:hypothetical protein